ncbi:TPA: hypothetical protein ACK3Q6_007822 [Burkholderia cepacia]|nr:hypothetical protein [Burkholderia cepacia]
MGIDEARKALRMKIDTLPDEDLAKLVRVASAAMNDIEWTAQIGVVSENGK